MKKRWGVGLLGLLFLMSALTVTVMAYNGTGDTENGDGSDVVQQMEAASDEDTGEADGGAGQQTAGMKFADDDGSGNWGWASAFIYACADRGIIGGFEDQTFRIEEGLTREQAAKIIAEAWNLPGGSGSDAETEENGGSGDEANPEDAGGSGDASLEEEGGSSIFTDSSLIQPWAVPYVDRCVDAGVIKGYEDGTFRPQKTVTRAEFCKLIDSAASLSGGKDSSAFRDDDNTGSWGWASGSIYACYKNGIVGGYEDGNFRPANPVTRGQSAKIIAIAAGLAEPQAVTDRQKAALKDAKTVVGNSLQSFTSLLRTLINDYGYTNDEAGYGAINCGANWSIMAMNTGAAILDALDGGLITRDAFVSTLINDYGFTEGQAEFAALHCDAEWLQPNETIAWDSSWQWASNSKIHDSTVTLYRAQSDRKEIVVAVNAGHGTSGGTSVKTLCHPDGSAKVTGGSTSAGATYATAINEGTTLSGSTPERAATLKLALIVKDDMLEAGYDVLMLRETDDTRLDNLARTIIANNCADCHISIHYDSTSSNKGLFYCSVPDNSRYRNMEPVKSHWKEHNALGDAILAGMRENGVKIWSSGTLETDLTQTSYSTVPSAVVEVGDKTSSRSDAALAKLSAGFVRGVDIYFGK